MKECKLIKMSKDTRFVGINREDEKSFRPGYIMEFFPVGSKDVTVAVSDGFISMKAEEPYFIAKSCYSQHSVTFSMSQLNNSMAKHGFKFVIESIPPVSDDGVERMYERSKSTGLCRFQPMKGGGRICLSCPSLGPAKECKIGDEVIIERFNDNIEYCYKPERHE